MDILRSDDSNVYSPVSTSFDQQTGLIQAHLDKVDYGFIDQPISYQGKIFQPKNELHITLISQDREAIIKYLQNHPNDIDDIQDLVLSADFSFLKLDEYYYVEERPGVETIIQMVDVPGLRTFFKDLSKLIGQGFIVPPTHVTLYTRGTEKGISLPDQRTFQMLAKKPVRPREVQLEEKSSASKGMDQGLAG